MINPNDVELLIFDLDGTILQSGQAISEAIKTALFKVNQNIQISNEDIENHLGEPSEEFYSNILPAEIYPLWQEVRTEVRKVYVSSLENFGQAFPDAIETMVILKKRGYRLALYSNSSVQYFDAAISTLGIQGYFDFTECSEENGLTKTELVQKIKNYFPDFNSTVIGDRIDDIKAARENDSLSVRALYGYGGKEPEQADITINTFSELLNIFDRKIPIFDKILDEINSRKQKNKAFVTGITGIDCSGKTKFAESLEQFLISKDFSTQLISLDDFHNPMVYKYSGED